MIRYALLEDYFLLKNLSVLKETKFPHMSIIFLNYEGYTFRFIEAIIFKLLEGFSLYVCRHAIFSRVDEESCVSQMKKQSSVSFSVFPK